MHATHTFQHNPDGEPQASTAQSRFRYPYGNRVFVMNLLGGVMASLILLEITLIGAANYLDQYISAVVLLGGGIMVLGFHERSFRRLKNQINSANQKIPMREITRKGARRRIYRNTTLLLLGLIVPIVLSYVLDPTLWLLSVVSFFTALVVGRILFFLRVRFWESRSKISLSTYTSISPDSRGATIYELGILAEAQTRKNSIHH